jgi:Bacterial Ig-like domain
MDPDTLTDSSVFLINTRTGGAVKAEVSCDSPCKTVTLNPWTRLAKKRTYKVIITTDVKDLVGHAMEQNYTRTFKTGRR